MARVKGGTVTRQRRKKVLKLAKGYFGSKHTLYKVANQQVMKSLMYAFRDRRQKKRHFRTLWVQRLSAACKQRGISYAEMEQAAFAAASIKDYVTPQQLADQILFLASPLAGFMTNPAGAAIVNAVGPIRQVVDGGEALSGASSPRR